MHEPCRQEIVNSVIQAIKQAQKDYKKGAWTPLCQCPEYLTTSKIFDSLLRLTKKDSLTLESKPSELLEYLDEIPRRGRPRSVPSNARLSGRIDVCLWNVGENRPRAIIEVKRSAETWKQDTKYIDRVSWLLTAKKYRKFQFGILASCIHKETGSDDKLESENKIRNTIKEIQQIINQKLDDQLCSKLEQSDFELLPLKSDYNNAEDCRDWIWRPVVFTIYRKRKR